MIAIVKTFSGKIRLINYKEVNGYYVLSYKYDEPFFILSISDDNNSSSLPIFEGKSDSILYQNQYFSDKRLPVPPEQYFHSSNSNLNFQITSVRIEEQLFEVLNSVNANIYHILTNTQR